MVATEHTDDDGKLLQTDGIMKTVSTASTSSGPKIPPRYDFGMGLRSCCICKVSRCFNRGCQKTRQVICEECWPAYVYGQGGLYDEYPDPSTSATLDIDCVEQAGSFFGKEHPSSSVPESSAYQLKPSVASWLMPKPPKVCGNLASVSATSTCHDNGLSEDDMAETSVDSSGEDDPSLDFALTTSALWSVREGTLEDEQEGCDGFLTSVANSRKLSIGSCDGKKKGTIAFVPGHVGIEWLEDTVVSVEADSQADRLGVRAGWKLRKLNGYRCASFEDRRVMAASCGTVPYELTFSFRICDESNSQMAPATEHIHTYTGVLGCPDDLTETSSSLPAQEQVHAKDLFAEDINAKDLSAEDINAKISALEAKFQKQRLEAEAVLAAVEERTIRASDITPKTSRDMDEEVWFEEDTEDIPEVPQEHDDQVGSAYSSSDDWGDAAVGRASYVSIDGVDKACLRAKIAELSMDVEVALQGTEYVSAELESATQRVYLARSRIESLEARIEAKQVELESTMRSAEKKKKQIQRRSETRKDSVQIEFHEAPLKTKGAPSFFACCTSSTVHDQICRTDNSKSWLYRWLNVTSI